MLFHNMKLFLLLNPLKNDDSVYNIVVGVTTR